MRLTTLDTRTMVLDGEKHEPAGVLLQKRLLVLPRLERVDGLDGLRVLQRQLGSESAVKGVRGDLGKCRHGGELGSRRLELAQETESEVTHRAGEDSPLLLGNKGQHTSCVESKDDYTGIYPRQQIPSWTSDRLLVTLDSLISFTKTYK
jgi:hypothetical protein